MTPRMYFVLVLRGIGAWKLVHSLEDFTTAWNIHEKLYTLPYATSTSFINLGVVNILVGAFLLVGASAIAALVVPGVHKQEASSSDTTNV